MKNKKVLIGAIAAVVVIVLAVLWATGVFNAPEKADEAVKAVEGAVEEAAETVEETAETVEEAAEEVKEAAEEAVEGAAEEVKEAVEEVKEEAAGEPAEAKTEITISLPYDATNEGRALLLLQAQGLIKLKADAGITATVADIEENKLGLKFNEVEAAMVPNVLADSDYAVINGNYALAAGLDKALLYENSESPYVNVVCVNEANKDSDLAKALAAAVQSQQVVDYFAETYKDGSAIATIDNPTDGYDASVDYEALKGQTIKIACTLDPHSFVLEKAKAILAEKEITLEIVVVDDYVTPNTMVDAGDVFANYFAHQPYQDNFNAENGTKIVTIAGVHVEPMGLYAGKQADLGALGLK